MVLETERTIMRPWQPEDAAVLFESAKDPDVGPRAGWMPHKDEAESAWIIANVLNGKECYAVIDKEKNIPVGSIELMLKGGRFSDREDECELGYWLAKPYWGKGLMPEAGEQLLRHAFEDLGMRAVWCANFIENSQSARVQEKLGFVYVRTMENVEMPMIHAFKTDIVRILTKEKWLADHSGK